MISLERLKPPVGRWLDRNLPPVEPVPSSSSPLPVWDVEPPHSTPRAACTLQSREQVWTAGRWREIARFECVRTSQGPAQTLLFLTDGGILGSRFDYSYPSRDEDEQVTARMAGAL